MKMRGFLRGYLSPLVLCILFLAAGAADPPWRFVSLCSRSARGRRANPSTGAIPGAGVGLDFHDPFSPRAHAVCPNPRFSCHLY
jgi:hypothetical protein